MRVPRVPSPRQALPLLAGLAAVVAVVAALVLAGGGDPAGTATARDPADVPRTRLAAGHVPAGGPEVARIEIPSIAVDAPLVSLGLNGDHTLQVPARAGQAGWWRGGARPGRRGTAVIAGHVDSKAGPAVFFRLRELRPGDRVAVSFPGAPEARFEVERSERVSKDRFPTRQVYASTGGAALRLITCGGAFDERSGHYRDNLIVFARRVPKARNG